MYAAAGATLLFAALARAGNCPSSPPPHCEAIQTEACAWSGKTTNALNFKGFPGQYSYTTSGYDPSSGACVQQQRTATGPIAPLTDGTHYVFRGPLKLSNFAVYSAGNAKSKRSTLTRRSTGHARRHAHAHLHERDDMVKATIDGKVVEFANTWSGNGGSSGSGSGSGSSSGSTPASNIASDAVTDLATGAWARAAHYSASNGTSDGLAFLYEPKYTDKVTFFSAGANGLSQASSNTVLPANYLLPDNTEFYIASGDACSASDPCPLYGKDVTAYHGFRGDRVVVFEFEMPLSGNRACDEWNAPNPDMPALWALNSEIVNNLQYGSCNGWKAGAGEHDIAEVLSTGSRNMFATMQMKPHYSGTEADALPRPVDAPMQLAVIYHGSTVAQQVLNGFEFPTSLSADDVNAISGQSSGGSKIAAALGSGLSTMNLLIGN